MQYKIITFDTTGQNPLVARSLALFGTRCTVLGNGLYPWRYSHKIDLALQAVREETADIILVSDAYDVLFLAHPREVVLRFLSAKCGMLINADKKLWPRSTDVDLQFGKLYETLTESPYRYLNSGCYIGYRDVVLDFLHAAKNAPDHPIFPGDDQAQFHHAFRAMHDTHKIRLDNHCDVFQVLNAVRSNEIERTWSFGVRNKVYSTFPIVVHANKTGRTNIFAELISVLG